MEPPKTRTCFVYLGLAFLFLKIVCKANFSKWIHRKYTLNLDSVTEVLCMKMYMLHIFTNLPTLGAFWDMIFSLGINPNPIAEI